MICHGCNRKIRWWQNQCFLPRFGMIHWRRQCVFDVIQRDVRQ